MNFEKYASSEIQTRVDALNESTVQLGETDKFKGDNFVGPHYHEYILWAPSIGYGKTGDALDIPKKGEMRNVPTHEHMIVDGKCLECAGHTHELIAPSKTTLSTNVSTNAIQVVDVTKEAK